MSTTRPVVEWMRQNDLPEDVPDDALIRVDQVCREIQVEVWMRAPDGAVMLHGGGHMFTELRNFPLLVDPPAGLLQAYDRLRASLREERSAIEALKRKMLEDTISELDEAGYMEAGAWLATRQLAANPAPSRQLVRFEVEAARVGPRIDGGPTLHPGCTVTVREKASLYVRGGTIVGYLDWCELRDGVLLLSGRALPRVVEQFTERSFYPCPDIFARGWADSSQQVFSEAEIISAMVLECADYPWRNRKGDEHVG